jgi:membrane fusion protein (multidrug efflux system)
MKHLIVIAVIIIFTLLIIKVLGSSFKIESKEAKINDINVERTSDDKAHVLVQKSIMGRLEEHVFGSGILRGIQEVEFKAQSTGEIKSVLVTNGQAVKMGDILIILESSEALATREKAKSNYLSKRSELEFRVKEFPDSMTQLLLKFEPKLADFEKENIVEKLFLAQNRLPKELNLIKQSVQYTEAAYNYASAENNYQKTIIKAPFSGSVSQLKWQEKDFLNAGQSICKLVNSERLFARVGVIPEDANRIKIGNKVIDQNNETITGRIIGIDKTMDPEIKLSQIDIELNKHPSLVSGIPINVYMVANLNEKHLIVPRRAILIRDNKTLVFIVRDNKAIWCYVTLGKQNFWYAEVLSSKMDLKENEHIITEGQTTLAHLAEVVVD